MISPIRLGVTSAWGLTSDMDLMERNLQNLQKGLECRNPLRYSCSLFKTFAALGKLLELLESSNKVKRAVNFLQPLPIVHREPGVEG